MVGEGRRFERSGLLFAGILAFAALAGCSSGGGSGNAGPTIASCNAYCVALSAAACVPPPYDTAEECKASECDGLGAEPARCLATTKAYYDCRAAQADICGDTGCVAEGDADLTCLLGGGGGGTGGGIGGSGGGGGGGGTSGGGTPASFGSRLVVWLDAARGTSGSPVASWADQSGAGNNATQAMAGRQPALTAAGINGLPSITFDGASTFLQIADSATTRWGTGDFTLMVVARGAPNVATNAMLYNKSELADPFTGINLYLNATGAVSTAKAAIQLGAGFAATTQDDFVDAAPHVFGGRLVRSTGALRLEMRVDGASQGSVDVVGNFTINIDAPGQATIIGHNGYSPTPGFQAFKGDISEIVAVKGTVTDAELADLEDYLISKYGL